MVKLYHVNVAKVNHVYKNVILVYKDWIRNLIIDMARTKKVKMGVSKGTVNNPQGINQWQDIRADKPISVRLLREQDKAIRAKASSEGKTLTQIMEEAIALYLAS